MFRITQGKGFQLDFSNGWTISVQFGRFNYCDSSTSAHGEAQAVTAEIGVFRTGGPEWYRLGDYDDVVGWLSPDQVAIVIARVQAMSSCPLPAFIVEEDGCERPVVDPHGVMVGLR